MTYIDPQQLLDDGYIQEINRQLLHPLGLALAVEVSPSGAARILGVFDYSDDPAGVIFSEGVLSLAKAARFAELQASRREAREAELGFWVQPLPLGD